MNKLKEIDKLIEKHKKVNVDTGDGFFRYFCEVSENYNHRIAPKGEWRGSEESRLESLKFQEEMDKNVSCHTCKLLKKVRNIIMAK